MAATNPQRYVDLVHRFGWDIIPRLAALGIQNLAEAQFLFVDSGATNALDADDTQHGYSFDTPLATIDYAIGLCTASEQSVILVAPGHAETKAAAGACITADVIGVKIICLGEGTLRPTITLTTDTGAIALSVTAANVTVQNLLVVCSKDAVAKAINVAAADCHLEDVEVKDNADSTEAAIGILTTAAADRLRIKRFKHNGFLAGDACTESIRLNGVDDCIIEDSWFRGKFSTAGIQMVTAACSGVVIRDCVFENGTTALSADIVDVASSKWSAVNCWDVVGGYSFSGGSGTALAADDVSAVIAQVNKIDAVTLDTTPVSASLATFVAGGAGGIGTQLPTTTSLYDTTKNVNTVGVTAAPVANTLADTLHKNGSFTYDNTTDALEAIRDEIDKITAGTMSRAFYVNANVVSSGAGTTWATAFKTIDEAIAVATTRNDRIYVAPGDYDEANTIAITTQGLHIIGPGPDTQNKAMVYDGAAGGYDLMTINAHEVIIDGLAFSAAGDTYDAIIVGSTTPSYKVTIRNCRFDGWSGEYAIQNVEDCPDLLIEHNLFRSWNTAAVSLNCTRACVRNNIFHVVTDKIGLEHISAGGDRPDNVYVDNLFSGISNASTTGIKFTGAPSNGTCIVARNIFAGTWNTPITQVAATIGIENYAASAAGGGLVDTCSS